MKTNFNHSIPAFNDTANGVVARAFNLALIGMVGVLTYAQFIALS